jgi:hypothetical protein
MHYDHLCVTKQQKYYARLCDLRVEQDQQQKPYVHPFEIRQQMLYALPYEIQLLKLFVIKLRIPYGHLYEIQLLKLCALHEV